VKYLVTAIPSQPLNEPVSVKTQVSDTPIVEENTPAAAGQVEISELDPCKLVRKENVEAVLGKSVDEPITAQDIIVTSCTYIAILGEKYLTIAVYEWIRLKISNQGYSVVAELSENAHTYLYFIQGAFISVATQNAFFTFLVGMLTQYARRRWTRQRNF
jgi:hypothetical protein